LSQSGVVAHLPLVRGRLVDAGQPASLLSLSPRAGTASFSG